MKILKEKKKHNPFENLPLGSLSYARESWHNPSKNETIHKFLEKQNLWRYFKAMQKHFLLCLLADQKEKNCIAHRPITPNGIVRSVK